MKIRLATKEEWNSWVARSPQATFFHSYDWYAIWSQYQRGDFEARIFEFAGEPKALLPLLLKKVLKGQMETYTSSPVGTYGSFICVPSMEEEEKKVLAEYLRKLPFLYLYENPFDRGISSFIKWNNTDFTQVLSLDKPLEAIVATWSSNHRRSLKKVLQSNLWIEVATKREEWEAYFQLYLQSNERWGARSLSTHDWLLFDLIRQLPPEKCRLWLAKEKDQTISGCLCFYSHQHVVYWHGASAANAFEKRPVHLLHYRIIEHALQQGLDYYDFNPSGDLEGVIHFKKGFGTFRMEMKRLEKEPIAYRLLSGLYHKLKRK